MMHTHTPETPAKSPAETLRERLRSGVEVTVDALRALRDNMPKPDEARELAREIGRYVKEKSQTLQEHVRKELQELQGKLEAQGITGQATELGDVVSERTKTTAHRADLLYRKTLRWVEENPAARYVGIGLLAISAAYLAHRFTTWVAGTEEHPTFFRRFLKFAGMGAFGWAAYRIVNHYGARAEAEEQERRDAIIKHSEHPVDFTSSKLSHLSLLGLPFTVNLGKEKVKVEFAGQEGGTLVRIGGKTYCIWTVTTKEGGDIAMTNRSDQVTDVIRGNDGLIFRGGPVGAISVHVSTEQVQRIVDALRKGPQEFLVPDVEYTSLIGANAQTVRFAAL